MDRLFLDANVLFSAASREGAGLRRLWRLGGGALITSAYALEEARVNLSEPSQRQRLDQLAAKLTIGAWRDAPLSAHAAQLPDKDAPILQAAIDARATHLLTGDRTHFGRYFGGKTGGVLIMPPGDYLRARGGR